MDNEKVSTRKSGSGGTTYDHPSYGAITMNRVTGSTPLFGSPLAHDRFVCLRIHEASLDRSLHEDRVHARKVLVEVNLSAHQLSRLVSAYDGEAIPATIRSFNGEMRPPCPKPATAEVVDSEAAEAVAKISGLLKTLEAEAATILDGTGTVKKADRTRLLNLVRNARMQAESNAPFLLSQFREQMQGTVAAAKSEVESWVQDRVQRFGLNSLTEMGRILGTGGNAALSSGEDSPEHD